MNRSIKGKQKYSHGLDRQEGRPPRAFSAVTCHACLA